MNVAYIGLGSNIEPRYEYLTHAIHLLEEHPDIIIRKRSSIYETIPVGYKEQALFLNVVLQLETGLSPHELLQYCQEIEKKLGRKRIIRFGPRTVDLDILLYNQESVDTDELIIPHPRMLERAFVLIPLAEINDELVIDKKSIPEYISMLSDHDCRGVTKWLQISGE